MKTFDEIYGELHSADNNELYKVWQEAKKVHDKAMRTAKIICLIIDILFVIMFIKKLNTGSLVLGLPSIIFVIVINVIVFGVALAIAGANKSNREFLSKYKNVVINKLMNNFYDNLEYFPNKPMPEYIYRNLKYEFYDHYKSEDYLEAKINGKYSIQMGEVLTEKEEEYKDSEGNIEKRIVTVFHGLFAKIEMDKSINSELKIMQNGAFLLNKRLKMDSSEFEKYFDVKASNQIIGMQILTADVMEELVEFENKTKMKFDIIVNGNEIYLRFHSGAMFEPGSFKKEYLDKDLLEKYFYMLNFTYNLSNKLIKIIEDTEI